jgi:ferredoxin
LRLKRRGDFAAMLVDLNQLVAPVLYLVDGVVGMEGDGPRNGVPKQAGLLLAGTNGFAVDLVMADIMDFPAERLPVAAEALLRGIVPALSTIERIGSACDAKIPFVRPRNLESLDGRLPPWFVSFGQQQLTARPVIEANCAGCSRCVRHCPPQAMAIKAGKAVIDYSRCIRCYCCQELCPHNAVSLKEGFLLRGIRRGVRWLR